MAGAHGRDVEPVEAAGDADIGVVRAEVGGGVESDPANALDMGFGPEPLLGEAGVPVTVVPGVTSAIAVPALAGVPVIHRHVTHEFVVVSGHVAPGHPESLVNWDALAAMHGTIVLLMAIERIEQFSAVLQKGGRPAETPVLVVQHGTTSAQQTLRATLRDAAERIRSEGIRPPAIIVVGAVAAFKGLKDS